jgi:hypothetical protein
MMSDVCESLTENGSGSEISDRRVESDVEERCSEGCIGRIGGLG